MAVTKRVLISGGGIGGLALAQGLMRRGFAVRVFEREPAGERAGFRLLMNADGGNALEALLPPHLYRLYQFTSRRDPRREQVRFLDSQLRTVVIRPSFGPPDRAEPRHTATHRGTLRQVLASGLSQVIRRETVVGYEERGDRVAALLADGSAVEGDVLVGADGIDSPIRRQMLPDVRVVDSGLRGILGRSPLPDTTAESLPKQFFDGLVVVLGPLMFEHGVVVLGAFQSRMPYPEAVSRFAPEVELTPVDPYMMLGAWVPKVVVDQLHLDVDGATRAGLARTMRELVNGWHPEIVSLVDRAHRADLSSSSMRHMEISPPWEPRRVTLLGDAIHAMPHTQNAGANLALRDAALLAARLAEARDASGDAIVRAVSAYERQMRAYDFPILRDAVTAEELSTGISPLGLLRLARLVGPRNLARKAHHDRRAAGTT